ncbi:MAG: hypothetical protein EBS19_12345, partial [Spirochaetia bacterium]|nr:hypothetical protein [Spirochaetia bacterium]
MIVTSLSFCSSPILKNMNINKNIELHGHRGARGLMPENTLPAFQKAVDLGMNFLELDVVLTKDKQIAKEAAITAEEFLAKDKISNSKKFCTASGDPHFTNYDGEDMFYHQTGDTITWPYGRPL